MATFKIVRMFKANRKPRVMKRGLTREQAQAHCRRDDTKMAGVWFDGFEEE